METNKVYLPFRFRLTPIKRTALINFRNDPDSEFKSFEIEAIEQNGTDEFGFQVLAWRQDDYKEVYRQKGLNTDQDEELITVGGKGFKEEYKADFKNTYFTIDDDILKIGFTFKDKDGRPIVFRLEEELDESSQKLSWLPSVGYDIVNPVSLPLFYLYKFDFSQKKKTEVFLSIDGEEHAIDPYSFPKDFNPRLSVQYSTDTVIINFNENRETTLPAVELDENGNARHNGKSYHYEKVDGVYCLDTVTIEHPTHPVDVSFDPPFPSHKQLEEAKPNFGTFTFYPDDNLGKLTGQYNVTRQGNKAVINLTFEEGWKPEKSASYQHIINNLSTRDIINWYKSYQCNATVNLDTYETKVEWKKVNPNRR